MRIRNFKSTYLFLFLGLNFQLISCAQQPHQIKTGASQIALYLPDIQYKKIAVVANQTSVLFSKNGIQIHLVDTLLTQGVDVVKVFAPEHGFRGKADAGEEIVDGIDAKTQLPIISLYGANKKPSAKQLAGIELVVFDIQDVGVRFYTYISTLHYVLEACAELNIPVLLLDRPNPNGHYIDGPVLEKAHQSFVGMHPVPVVYGMTIGEYGNMINGEGWLQNGLQCELTVVPLKNYTHQTTYALPVKPSPNLPNSKAIHLYPSLCFFEGTTVSVGRGTEQQFQIYGAPFFKKTDFSFVPMPNEGAKYPKHKGERCFGENLATTKRLENIDLQWLLKAYRQKTTAPFFNAFFTKLAGTKKLQDQIEKGLSEAAIRTSWQAALHRFQKIRTQYLLYK